MWDVHVVAVARWRGRCGIARGLVVGGVWRGYYRIEPCFDATATAATINGLPQKLFFLHLYSDDNQLFWSSKRLERENGKYHLVVVGKEEIGKMSESSEKVCVENEEKVQKKKEKKRNKLKVCLNENKDKKKCC